MVVDLSAVAWKVSIGHVPNLKREFQPSLDEKDEHNSDSSSTDASCTMEVDHGSCRTKNREGNETPMVVHMVVFC